MVKKSPAKKSAAAPVANNKGSGETDAEKERIIAVLVAHHGYSYDAAKTLVSSSRPARKPVSVSPENDHVKTVTVGFNPRAGVGSYVLELQERLQDLEEEKNRLFYVLPVRLPKKLYRFLIEDTLAEERDPTETAAYTEENHICTILLERMAMSGLTAARDAD